MKQIETVARTNIYLLKVTIETIEKGVKYVKLTIKPSERHQRRRSGVFFINSEHISHLFLVFLLLTLNK